MAGTSAKSRASGTSAAQTIASSGDRARAFSSARRHSILVRILKLALPVGAVLSLAGYGGYYPAEISGGMRKRAGLARAGIAFSVAAAALLRAIPSLTLMKLGGLLGAAGLPGVVVVEPWQVG